MKAVEVEAILDCAEIAAAASLERKESRWGVYHRRVDFPGRNDGEWKKFVVVQKMDTGRMSVSTEPVPGG
jgi:succinate dehydrogenase/fumarate reductase flavoprotein subunit